MYTRVCVCLRKYTYATTSATSKHDCWHKAEGTRTCKCEMANFSRRELDSFYTFCSPSLVPPFNPAYPPFLFLFHSLIPPLTFSYDFFSSSSVRVARPRCRLPGRDSKRFTRGFSRGIQTKINRTTKGRVVHLVQVCREENQRTLMREVIDCRFLSFKG